MGSADINGDGINGDLLPGSKRGSRRIGDIHFATVNGEVYSQIAMRLKANAPASKTMVVTLANGSGNSGYIYSDRPKAISRFK